MSGLAELEKTGAFAADPYAEKVVGLMRECCRRVLRFTDDLNDLAAIQSGRFVLRCSRVDLTALTRYATDAALAKARATGTTLVIRLDTPGPTWVRADEDRLAQALVNLIECVASHVGGKKHLVVALRSEGPELAVEWECDESQQAELETFEAALRTPPCDEVPRADRHATFGLSVACSIVRAHRGKIRMESSESAHRIVIELPAI